ncbi:olfactory receptor 19-like [Heterocephalus glaber]|uniref:Olfactory receptor 19-like n=1 Tax=Heterocephalus glaber TaxID=10181 RepID=A0AAX6QD38_HETGA|nr:olfactory receptor 19-like [Heterocephalus glaber]
MSDKDHNQSYQLDVSHNETQTSQFLLLGISEDSSLQPFLFGLFLSMYLVTVLGNLLMILATISDSHLHTPMYLFLSNLSFADICFTSTSIPKMLVNIQIQSKVITYEGCITQVYFFIVFGVLDNVILDVMAYDHFVAICHPLQYMVIINLRVCGYLVLGSWITAALNSLLQTLTGLRLSFCTDLEIPHFVCDLNQLVLLACSDTFVNDMVMYFAAVLLGGGPLAGILYSYANVVSRLRSPQNLQVAVSDVCRDWLILGPEYHQRYSINVFSDERDSGNTTARRLKQQRVLVKFVGI